MKLTIYQNGRSVVFTSSAPILLSTLLTKTHNTISLPCGGHGRCHKCKVIARGQLSPLTEIESAFLTDEEMRKNVRFACMTTALGDAEIILPEQPRHQILTTGHMPEFPLIPWAQGYGAAFDIGTTTVAAYLYDLTSGNCLASDAEKNPQSVFGADVISRISYAVSEGTAALAAAIRDGINTLLSRLCHQAQIPIASLSALVLTGNTAMEYFLTGTNPAALAQAPFVQDRWFGEFCSASDLGLAASNASVYLTRSISAYVGGDITSGILATEMTAAREPVLLADIGTNGELALSHHGELLCCSTAAGPAFEGAGIFQGMTASHGAISQVCAKDGTLSYHTIGNTTPAGICGSGVIDAVAACLTLGFLDETGAIDEACIPKELRASADGVPAIRFPESDIVLTQKDIRAVQLAKSAICSGIETLLSHAGLHAKDVAHLWIAGGFGTVLNTESAERIGLIPSGFSGRMTAVGNAAGMGAVMQLLSKEMIATAEELAQRARTIELSSDPVFCEAYLANLLFPDCES